MFDVQVTICIYNNQKVTVFCLIHKIILPL